MRRSPCQSAKAEPSRFRARCDPVVSASLSFLFQSAGLPVDAFTSPEEFLRYPPHAGPVCLVLDLQMPDMDGLTVQSHLARAGRSIPIVFVSGHADVPAAAQAMRAGAVDFLVKPVDESLLLDAVTRSLNIDRAARQRGREQSESADRLSRLTPRELEVAQLVSGGRLNKELARALGISEETVKVHRGHVMRKLDVDSVPALVRLIDRRTS